MSESVKPEIGSIAWTDLTIENAQEVRDFYARVVGWEASPVDMGDYSDFNMSSPGNGEVRAGICHSRGGNAGLPTQWMNYVIVADVDASCELCVELGGRVLAGPKEMGGYGRYSVIEDPAGAVMALFTPVED